jgi:xanthine/uracil permease
VKVVSVLVLLGVGWVVGAWCLMLLIGSLHHAWWPAIPTISYTGALQIELVVMFTVALGGVVKALVEAVSDR